MRSKAVALEEQYRLIMECRASGLTDYQWGLNRNIKPGTFYNWVRRLRKTGCYDIPAPSKLRKPSRQEVVKVEIAAPVSDPGLCAAARTVGSTPLEYLPAGEAVMEIILRGAAVRIPNGTDPVLLEHVLRMLGEPSC